MWNGWKLLAVPLLLLAGADALAQNTSEQVTPEAIQRTARATAPAPELTATDINAWLDGFMPYALANADIVGAVVTIVRDGEILANRGYGYADLKNRTPVDPDHTLFRPGSISKLFTWTAVMQQVEQGRIDLDADVNTYVDFKIPDYDGLPVTMRQIMTHTAGFEEVAQDLIISDPTLSPALGDFLRVNLPTRIYPPGTMPAYSNYATALAGYVVERVSGQPFAEYIQQHIFAPLGMRNSTFLQPVPESLLSTVSLGYKSVSDAEPQFFEIIPAAPAGGLSLTGADMARFMNAHLADGAGLMRPETARMMHETVDRQFPGVNSMVLGFYQENQNGKRIIAHGGDTNWFHSNLSLLLDRKVGVYISLNSGGAATLAAALLRQEFMSQFMDRYFPAPFTEVVARPTAREHGARIVGDYESARRAETNPLLVLSFAGQTRVSMLPDGDLMGPGLPEVNGEEKHWREVEPWVWQAVGSDERMGARVDESGRVLAIAYEPLSAVIPFTRAPWWRAKSWLLPAFGAAITVFALTLASWPVRAVARRVYRAPFPYEGARAWAYRLAPVISLLMLAYIGAWTGFLAWLINAVTISGAGSDALLMALYMAGIVPVLALAGAVYVNRVLWLQPTGWFARAWAGLLASAVVLAVWFAVVMRFYSFDFTY